MSENASDSELRVRYGQLIALYQGEGKIILKGTAQSVDCTFEIGQLTTGRVELLCTFPWEASINLELVANNVEIFRGQTTDGYSVIAQGIYGPHFTTTGNGKIAQYQVQEAQIELSSNAAKRIHFGLTNFEFMGIEAEEPHKSYLTLPLELLSQNISVKLKLKQVENYKAIVRGLKLPPRSTNVTSEAMIEIASQDSDLGTLKQVVSDLCDILSVARGTRINWVYVDQFDRADKHISRTHCSRITRPFAPMSAIDPGIISADLSEELSNAESRPDGRYATKTFVEGAYPIYTKNASHHGLYRRIINPYLDAKPDIAFTESRSATFAIAMEVIKDVAPDLFNLPNGGQIVSKAIFKQLSKAIKAQIDTTVTDPNSRRAMKDKLGELNRIPFRSLIDQFCKKIGLTVTEQEIRLFVASRNKLIHSGQFYCDAATAEERKKLPPLATRTDEYLFLVNFLDRAILKMFGYSGPYIDVRIANKPLIDLI